MNSIDKEFLKFFDQGSDFLKIFEKQMKTFFGDAFPSSEGLSEIPSIESLTGMPHLDNLFGVDKKVKDFVKASSALHSANTELQALISKSWFEAFQRFCTATGDNTWYEKSFDEWLEYANRSMDDFQRTDEFMSAQREMINASTDFRNCYTELVEVYQEKNNIPTRREIDDLSRSVYELKRELKKLKKELKISKTQSPCEGRDE